MGLCIDIRVDPDRHGGPLSDALGDLGEQLQFRFGLDIETGDTLAQRQRHFTRRLADAREHDLAGRDTGSKRPAQLTFRHDVHARTLLRHGADDGLIGIGLHRVADQVIGAGKSIVHHLEVAFQRGGGIAVERRSNLIGQHLKIDVFGVEHAIAISKMMHVTGSVPWVRCAALRGRP